jgi:hypothetical protein
MDENQFLLHSFRNFLKETDKTWNYNKALALRYSHN